MCYGETTRRLVQCVPSENNRVFMGVKYMKVRVCCTILIIAIMTMTCVGCDGLSGEQDMLDTTRHETGETSKSNEPVLDVGEQEKPYASETIEKFLLDWEVASTEGTDQCAYEYRFLLCTMCSDGGYYVNTPVIVNEGYFLRGAYAHDKVYEFIISPMDELDEHRSNVDYKTSIVVQVKKSYTSFAAVVNQYGLDVDNGVAVRHTTYGYSQWLTDFKGRAISIYVPDSLGVEKIEQLSDYFVFETYSLVEGHLTKVE